MNSGKSGKFGGPVAEEQKGTYQHLLKMDITARLSPDPAIVGTPDVYEHHNHNSKIPAVLLQPGVTCVPAPEKAVLIKAEKKQINIAKDRHL